MDERRHKHRDRYRRLHRTNHNDNDGCTDDNEHDDAPTRNEYHDINDTADYHGRPDHHSGPLDDEPTYLIEHNRGFHDNCRHDDDRTRDDLDDERAIDDFLAAIHDLKHPDNVPVRADDLYQLARWLDNHERTDPLYRAARTLVEHAGDINLREPSGDG